MRGDQLRQIGFLIARRTAGRKSIDKTILVPPVAREKIARDAAMIDAGAVSVGQAVMRRDASQRWGCKRTHEPLQHAKIRLANAADFPAAPRLPTNPFDDVVEILLFTAPEKLELTARPAAAANVHVNVGVALLDVPLDRPRFPPEKLRTCRQAVV